MKRLLVTGFVRSGTTFLANLLNSQDGVTVYRDFLRSIFNTAKRLNIESFNQALTLREKNILLTALKSEADSIGFQGYNDVAPQFSTLKELYYFALAAIREDARIVGSKITRLEEWLPKMVEQTDLHIVYIYRDPRDVLLSSKNMFTNYNLLRFIIDLKRELNLVKNMKYDRFLLLKFEDLITDPEKICKKLGMFLETTVSPNPGELSDRTNSGWKINTSFHDLEKTFDQKSCYRWKRDIGSDEVKYCDILMPKLLKEFGYEVTNTYPAVERARIRLHFALTQIVYQKWIIGLGRKIFLGL